MKLYEKDGSLIFYCPGCERGHTITRAWGFNEDFEKPSFIAYSIGIGNPSDADYCHSHIRNGMIEFCSDSKHKLSGMTVELPHIPETYGLP